MAIGEPSIGVIPRFSNLDGKPTDFNDMANRETPEAVNARILNAIRDIKDVPEPQPAPAPAIAPAVEPRANLPAPLPVQSPDVEAPEPKGDFDADSSKFFTIMGYDGEELYVYAHMLKQVINFNAAALYYKKTLLQLAKKYWWQRNFPPPDKSHDFINFDNMVEWFLDVAHFKRGIYDPSKVRGRGAWIDDGRIVFHFGNELMVNGQHMDLTSIKSEYVYSRRPRIRYPDQPSMTIADGKRIVEVAKRFRWVNPCSAHLLVGWAALAPLCGALQWRPHAWITAEAGSGKTHIQDKFAKWLTAGVSLYAAGGSTEAGIRQDLKNDAFPVLYDEGEQNTGQEAGRIQHVLALARQASTETGALTLKGTVDGSGMSFLIRSMFLLVSVQVGIKNQADHERIAKLVLKPKKEAGNSGLEWRKTKAMLLDLTKDKTLPARLLRRSMELLPTTLKNIEMFAEVAAELLGSQREGDQYGTLMAGYYSLISDREVLRGEAHLLMSGFTWSDYTEEGQIMSASGAKDILLTRKLRLDGGRECQVSELILRSSGQIVPSLDSMKADQADRALQLYGMRVEGDQLLIAKPHREIMATFRDTAHATNPYSELQSTPGATSDRKKSARFAGPSMRYISLPLADLLADTPAVATANSEDVPF